MSEINHTVIAPAAGRKVLVAIIAQSMTTDEARAIAAGIVQAADTADAASPLIVASALPQRPA